MYQCIFLAIYRGYSCYNPIYNWLFRGQLICASGWWLMFCSNLGLFQALNDINDTETVTATVTTAATTATSSSTGTTSISTTSATTSITSSSSTTSSTVKAGDCVFFFKS